MPSPRHGKSVSHSARLLLVLLAVALVATGGYLYSRTQKTPSPQKPTTSATTPPVSTPPPVSSTGTFRVVGNQIIAPNGTQFVPYGVVIECAALQVTSISSLCTGDDPSENTGIAVVDAAATDWSANVVRFQFAQENLFSGPNGSVDPAYVNLVDSLVDEANSLDMVAIVTLQEEDQSGYVFPTASSTRFWAYMADHFKNNPDVFFDLFNEPKLPPAAVPGGGAAATTTDNSAVWNVWRNGGLGLAAYYSKSSPLGTSDVQYVGMQDLVNTIRSEGADNIIIAEGLDADKDLSELPSHYLSGPNIAYGVEPNLHGDTTQAEQYQRFGQYTTTVPIMPEAFLDLYGTDSCDPGSPEDLPALLNYLTSLHMGLIFWSLNPGAGIIGNNLDDPTSYPPGATSIASPECPDKQGKQPPPNNTIGDGADIMAYFKEHSVKLPG